MEQDSKFKGIFKINQKVSKEYQNLSGSGSKAMGTEDKASPPSHLRQGVPQIHQDPLPFPSHTIALPASLEVRCDCVLEFRPVECGRN